MHSVMVSKPSRKRTPTSININEELWVELKILALKRRVPTVKLLEQAISEFLKRENKK